MDRPADSTKCIQRNPCPISSTSTWSYLYEVYPTNATFDGVHLHDDLLEDLGRQAVDAQIRDLGGFARRLAAIDPARLTDTERLERPVLEGNIRGRLFELEEVRTWERSPQHYADIMSTSLAGQALFDYAPLPERARRVLSKLRQVPKLIQAARDNIKDPPGIFVKVGLESMRGTLRFVTEISLAPSAASVISTCSAIWRMRRWRPQAQSGPISSTSSAISPREAKARFDLVATNSSRSSNWTRG